MRSRLAGCTPLWFVRGTVNLTVTRSPDRFAVTSAGADGTFSNGGSGGPFLPQAAPSATKTTAAASRSGSGRRRVTFGVDAADASGMREDVDRQHRNAVRESVTGCSATGRRR